MGKRTRTESDDYDNLVKKFKKLERKLLRGRRKHREPSLSPPPPSPPPPSPPPPPPPRPVPPPTIPLRRVSSSSESSSSSSSSSCSSSTNRSPVNFDLNTEDRQPELTSIAVTDQAQWEPVPSTSTAVIIPPDLSQVSAAASAELDGELLEVFGADPSLEKMYGKDIQTDLAVRLQHIATTGLTKDARKELLEKYLIPANSTLIDAPSLNPEVKAAVSESVYKRDTGIEQRQKQVASAISSVAEAITALLAKENKDMTVIKLLMDASRILCDSQNSDSVTRRNFIFYNLKKELKDQLQATKIDKLLFSKDLAETLKAAKAISKSSADLKPAPVYKPPFNKKNNQKSSSQKNLNWRAPLQYRRQKGMPKPKEPAHKRQDSASKQSSYRERESNRPRR